MTKTFQSSRSGNRTEQQTTSRACTAMLFPMLPIVALVSAACLASPGEIGHWFIAGVTAAGILLGFSVGRYSARNSILLRKLLQERQKLHVAIDSMSQGLVLFDAEERVIVCNARYVEMYGVSPVV